MASMILPAAQLSYCGLDGLQLPLPGETTVQCNVKHGGFASMSHRKRATGASRKSRHLAGKRQVSCSASAEGFTSPKTGSVGAERFKDSAVPGTYWGAERLQKEVVTVVFNTGSGQVEVSAHVGENLLRAAERCGAMEPTEEFCYEGTCCHCEMEVEGGAPEVGYRADPASGGLVRSCICPVPARAGPIIAHVLSEDDAWAESVL